MVRFATNRELLLLSRGNGKLFAYIVQADLLVQQARQEYAYYTHHRQLVSQHRNRRLLGLMWHHKQHLFWQ